MSGEALESIFALSPHVPDLGRGRVRYGFGEIAKDINFFEIVAGLRLKSLGETPALLLSGRKF
jgi:hypothetical protein